MDLFFRDLEGKQKKEFKKLSSYVETAKDHGRIEKREYYTFAGKGEIKQMLDTKWVHVECIGMTRLTRTVGEVTTIEVHYHLMDTETRQKNTWNFQGALGNREQPALDS